MKLKTLIIIAQLDDGSIRQVLTSDDTNDLIATLIVHQEGGFKVVEKELEGLIIE